MEYHGTLSSAVEWAQQGRLADWVHAYLCSDGHNQPFSDGLKKADRIYLGPVSLPLSLFHRCCGPEDTMTYRVDPTGWEKKVQNLQAAIQNGCDLPPLIVHYLIPEGQTEGEFELSDGNHRWEALARLGIAETSVIVWITNRCEYEPFKKRYGQYLQK